MPGSVSWSVEDFKLGAADAESHPMLQQDTGFWSGINPIDAEHRSAALHFP